MMKARIKLSWDLSPSLDVEKQNLKIVINSSSGDGDTFQEITKELEPHVNEHEFVSPEKVTIHVSLNVTDGINVSSYAILTFNLPDLTAPLPPTHLSYEILEVFESEPEPPIFPPDPIDVTPSG